MDIDERHFKDSLAFVKGKYGGSPSTETDFRRVLDNRDVDAVTIAAPDHWHALMTIWACQAGKDVYVEKPISHNIVEGRRMIEAARRYNRIVQVGTQRRSGALLGEGRASSYATEAWARSTWARPSSLACGIRSASWRTARCRPACTTTCGSGRHLPARSTRTTSTTTGTGSGSTGRRDLGNTGVHSLDAVRWLLGKQEHPQTAYCIGGLHEAGAPTDQATPNTWYATYQYADGTELHCDLRNWYGGPPEANGLYVFGSKGWMKVGDDKAQVFLGRKNEPGPTITVGEKGDSGQAHFENFIDCVRSRKADS